MLKPYENARRDLLYKREQHREHPQIRDKPKMVPCGHNQMRATPAQVMVGQ
jgi:hypothetical protein